MLKAFRNLTKSRFGLIIVFAVLAVIAIAFMLGDITGVRSSGTAGTRTVAKVGNVTITDREVRDRLDRFIRAMQAQGQNVSIEEFLKANQLEPLIDDLVRVTALAEYARSQGMEVSKRLIDGDVASVPDFQDLSGKFDKANFDAWLAQSRISMATFYSEQMRDRYQAWLLNTSVTGSHVPNGLALPYASLQLERRTGTVGFVQRNAMDAGPEPDDKTLNAFYTSHRALYMVPERRTIRYSVIKPDAIRATVAASEAEIADAYRKAGARFAAREKRSVSQLVLGDQATANRVAGEVKAGKSLADAAKAAGLQVATYEGIEKAELAKRVPAAAADAAFAAAQGAVAGPVKIPLGWAVIKVDKVEQIAAKSLEQARAELTDEILQRKTAQGIADRRQAIEDAIGEGKTFDELARDLKLAAERSPALAANGTDPLNPEYKPSPELAMIGRAGFSFEQPGDEPQVVPVAPDGTFAVVGLESITPAAPRAFADVRAKVISDYLIDYRMKQARKFASDISNLVNKGMPLAEAFAKVGVTKGVVIKPFDTTRGQMGTDPGIRTAFAMKPRTARIVQAPENGGYYVVYLATTEERSAASDANLLAGARRGLGGQVASEYRQQFIRAALSQVKVTRNADAIRQLREELGRTGVAN